MHKRDSHDTWGLPAGIRRGLAGRKCLVTGGAGFLGSRLCACLVDCGAQVTCLDNFSTGDRRRLARMDPSRLRVVRGDVNHFPTMKSLFGRSNFDYVFHYAALVGVKRNIEQPLSVLNDIQGIRNVAECAKRAGVRKVVFSSSSEVYGNPLELPEREDGAVNPQLPYGVVKLFGEKLLQAMYTQHGLRSCSLRFFNVYGPGQEGSDYGFVVAIFMQRVINGLPPVIHGDGSQTRDFMYMDDNIRLAAAAMVSRRTDGHVMNVGTGRPTTILELAEKIIRLSGRSLRPRFVPARTYDVRHRWPQVAKIRRLIRLAPRFTLEEGLEQTMKGCREL